MNNIKENLLKDLKKLRNKNGYLNAGFPRYDTLFGRDSLISAWQTLNIDPSIAKNTLEILATHQATEENSKKDAEPGKILHEYRKETKEVEELPDWGWPYYGSVDSTSLFLIVLREYVLISKDKKFLNDKWENVKRALEWHFNNASKNKYGFITYKRKEPEGLFHQGWKDSMINHLKIAPPVALVEEQGYAYLAYRYFVELSIVLGKDEKLRTKAINASESIKENLTKYFWWEKEKYFTIGLDDENKQREAVASNAGHLLACGDILNKEQAKCVRDRLFKKDMWTVRGIRTLSEKDPDFDPFAYHLGSIWPHDNWFIYIGLKAHGLESDAKNIKQALFKAYTDLGRIPELYAVKNDKIFPISNVDQIERAHHHHLKANPLQAWASGTLLNMLEK